MLILTTSVLVTGSNKEVIIRILCIDYPIQFQEGQELGKVLLNSDSKVNAMNPNYAWKLGLKIEKTNVRA